MGSRSASAESMKGSRSTGSSIGKGRSESFMDDRNPPLCDCNEFATLRTSWTDRNPGRRFYNCPKSGSSLSSSSCKFYMWIDPTMCERSKQIIPGLLKNIRSKEVELESVKSKLQDAESNLGLAESKLLMAAANLQISESKLKVLRRMMIMSWVICCLLFIVLLLKK